MITLLATKERWMVVRASLFLVLVTIQRSDSDADFATTITSFDDVSPTFFNQARDEDLTTVNNIDTSTYGIDEDDQDDDDDIDEKYDIEDIPDMDIVEKFLVYVSTIEKDKESCKKGTWHVTLPKGTVSYGPILYMDQARKTVDMANLYTRMWKTLEIDQIENGENFFYGTVSSLVENDDKIFAAGSCHDNKRFGTYNIFCPYAYREPGGTINVKDLSLEYHYLSNDSEWFYQARMKAQGVAQNESSRISNGKLAIVP